MKVFMSFIMLFCPLTGFAQESIVAKEATENIEANLSQIREAFNQEYLSQNWSLLAQNKESVDSFFLPLNIIMELGEDDATDLCRTYRYDYSPTNLSYVKSFSTEDEKAIKTCTQVYKIDSDKVIRFKVRMSRYPYTLNKYPVMINVVGIIDSQGMVAKSSWYEPYLANKLVDFPFFPENFTLYWDNNKNTLKTDDGKSIDNPNDRRPYFTSAHSVYTLNHALVLITPTLSQEIEGNSINFGDSNSGNYSNGYIKLFLEDGNLLRKTDFFVKKGMLNQITIAQNEFLLNHECSEIYMFNAANNTEQTYSPSTKVPYLKGGRKINIDFARHKEGVVPRELSIDNNGVRVFDAKYESVSISNNHRLKDRIKLIETEDVSEVLKNLRSVYGSLNRRDTSVDSEYYDIAIDEFLLKPHGFRAKIKYNIYLAIQQHDYFALNENLGYYREVSLASGVNDEMYVYNLEYIAQMSFEYASEEIASYLVFNHLQSVYSDCSEEVLISHIVRLVDQFRLGYALLAIDVLKGNTTNQNIKEWINNIRPLVFERVQESLRDKSFYPSNMVHADSQARFSGFILNTITNKRKGS